MTLSAVELKSQEEVGVRRMEVDGALWDFFIRQENAKGPAGERAQ